MDNSISITISIEQVIFVLILCIWAKFQAERCVVDLDVPHFHHEIVYEALVIALEDGSDKTINSIVELLHNFNKETMISYDQMNAVSNYHIYNMAGNILFPIIVSPLSLSLGEC